MPCRTLDHGLPNLYRALALRRAGVLQRGCGTAAAGEGRWAPLACSGRGGFSTLALPCAAPLLLIHPRVIEHRFKRASGERP